MLSIETDAFRYIDAVLSSAQWHELDSIVAQIEEKKVALERVMTGVNKLRDVKVSLHLHRFIVRENGLSKVTDSPYAKSVIRILGDSPLGDRVTEIAGRPVTVLRMQLNIMREGDFISEHTDKASDDAYVCTVLIRTASSYTGGDLTIYDVQDKPHRIRQPNHSILAMGVNCVHKVDPIISGFRRTITLFYG